MPKGNNNVHVQDKGEKSENKSDKKRKAVSPLLDQRDQTSRTGFCTGTRTGGVNTDINKPQTQVSTCKYIQQPTF